MSTLYRWEKIILGVVAALSFIAGTATGGLIDGVMALAINTLIVFALFKIGNHFFTPKEKPTVHGSE